MSFIKHKTVGGLNTDERAYTAYNDSNWSTLPVKQKQNINPSKRVPIVYDVNWLLRKETHFFTAQISNKISWLCDQEV